MKVKLLHWLFALFVCVGSIPSFSQQKGFDYVPCQEMPQIMQQYNADYRAVARFYSPASTSQRGGGFGGGSFEGGIGSPEKREKLNRINKDYLRKLQSINFKNLSQECKVDYILFKRDLTQRIDASSKTNLDYDKIKQWFPFATIRFFTLLLNPRYGTPSGEQGLKPYQMLFFSGILNRSPGKYFGIELTMPSTRLRLTWLLIDPISIVPP